MIREDADLVFMWDVMLGADEAKQTIAIDLSSELCS